MLVGLFVLIVFGIGAASMFTRYMPALLTLPIMAVVIAGGTALMTGQITFYDVLSGVVQEGAYRLHEFMIIAMFGGMLSFLMQKSGVAQSLIKNGAELMGDNPLFVSVFVMLLVTVLFSTIGGLGAVIMVAMVVLPVLSTLGVPPITCGGIMLFGISMGGAMNAGNWGFYMTILSLDSSIVRDFALCALSLLGVSGVTFIVIELMRAGTLRDRKQALLVMAVTALLAGGVVGLVLSKGNPKPKAEQPASAELADGSNNSPATSEADAFLEPAPVAGASIAPTVAPPPPGRSVGGWIALLVKVAIGAFFAWVVYLATSDLLRKVKRWRQQVVEIKWYAYLIPIVPIVPLLMFDGFPILGAFFIGVLFAILVTARPGSVSMTVQSMIQGSSSVMAAVLLMVGIGMLLKAVNGPNDWKERDRTRIATGDVLQGFNWNTSDLTSKFDLLEGDPSAFAVVPSPRPRAKAEDKALAVTIPGAADGKPGQVAIRFAQGIDLKNVFDAGEVSKKVYLQLFAASPEASGVTVGVSLVEREKGGSLHFASVPLAGAGEKVAVQLLEGAKLDGTLPPRAVHLRSFSLTLSNTLATPVTVTLDELRFVRSTWPVQQAIKPWFELIVPKTGWGYVVVFTLLAPLALYRGPLNLWGIGGGIMAILLATGILPPIAIMAMFMSVGQMQGICDPTNTVNVWLANELRVDVQQLLWRTLPYVWAMVLAGLSLAAFLYQIGA